MPSRFTGVFGSYDLFAKAVPGAAFLMGIISLLPKHDGPLGSVDSTLLLTALIIIFLILGFILGQALHSFAVTVERTAYRSAKLIYHNFEFFRPGFWRGTSLENVERSREDLSSIENRITNSRYFQYVHGTMGAMYLPVLLVCYQLLVPHRILFRRQLRNEFINSQSPPLLCKEFATELSKYLDSHAHHEVDYDDIYTIVMSQQEFLQAGRARQFQAIFSFCRSTWTTLLFFVTAYIGIIVIDGSTAPSILNHQPLISYVTSTSTDLLFIIFWMVLVSFLLMLSEVHYKNQFVDYVMADFVSASKERKSGDSFG